MECVTYMYCGGITLHIYYMNIYHGTERLPNSNTTVISKHNKKKGIYSVFCKKYRKKETPGNVIRTSQFSVGTVFIQDLWDMMCLPACSSRFPNNLSEKHNKEREREKKTNVSHFAVLLWTNSPTPCRSFSPHSQSPD